MPEKAMAPHSSVLAWRIPGTGEPGGLPSMPNHWIAREFPVSTILNVHTVLDKVYVP